MTEVRFYDQIDDELLKFAVIVSRYKDKWVFCKHKARNTYECPGGHRETGEDIDKTARRELWEETGAEQYELKKICVYSVADHEEESFGMLYYAEIFAWGKMPELEIERVELFEDLPSDWTYPLIQPYLINKVCETLEQGKKKQVFLDRTENTGCTSVFVQGAEVIPAGTTVYSMSVKHKNAEYQKYADEYDIHFLFDDKLPIIDFYTIPQVDVFATDSKGGLFGTVGQMTDMDSEALICYIDSDRNCFIIADNGRNFLRSASEWRKKLVPDKEIKFFPSKAEAVKNYEFICSYDFILNKIAVKYQEILKDKLTGIYVHGSIAFGCFNWEVSDIDFIVVVKDVLSLAEKERLIKTLLELDGAAPPKGLEMSIVLDKYCNPFVYPTPFELHFSNMHKEGCRQNLKEYCENMHGLDKDLAAHFTVIRTVGKVLCGEEIPAVFGKVPKENYLDSIKCDVENAVNEIMENPVYMILNLCRVLAFMEEDAIISKEQGGQWGMQNLPEAYRPVVEKALRNYCYNEVFREEEEKLKSFAAFCKKVVDNVQIMYNK